MEVVAVVVVVDGNGVVDVSARANIKIPKDSKQIKNIIS